MFRNLFGGGNTPDRRQYEAGQKLFAEGVNAASYYRTAEAISLYTRSFEANPNPAPLINRAKLYRWRLLFEKAIEDLELAVKIDRQQSNEFSNELGRELRECRLVAENLFNGRKKLFVEDLRDKGFDYVSGRIADSIFKGDGRLLAYHLVNEVDNVKKFEVTDDFPAVKTLLQNWMTDQAVIDQTLENREISNQYQSKRLIFESMVSVYDYPDVAKMRDTLVRKIWCHLNPPSQMQPLWEVSLRNPTD